jgi:hypothetical protein
MGPLSHYNAERRKRKEKLRRISGNVPKKMGGIYYDINKTLKKYLYKKKSQ